MRVSQIIINFGDYMRPFKLIPPSEFDPKDPPTEFKIDNSTLSLNLPKGQISNFNKVTVNPTTEKSIYFRPTSRRDVYFIDSDKVNELNNKPINNIIIDTVDLIKSTKVDIDYFRYSTQYICIENNSIKIIYDLKY